MNYVFISPGYPIACTLFCEQLYFRGINVLGIGDMPYDALNEKLKSVLTEYYYVPSLEDYDQAYRAAAYFIHKYGRIDWLESMNEYWLPLDARLRTDFNIAVGTRTDGIHALTSKSGMKRIFLEAGIPTARQHLVTDLAEAKKFVRRTGYPVIVKPDIGVGANGAFKLKNDEDLAAFYNDLPDVPYVMEEFLSGDICTYDAVIDSRLTPLFESMCTYAPVLDAVQEDEDVTFYTTGEVPAGLRELGRRTVKAFGAGRRFIHFEFIHLAKDCAGIGKAGEYAVMEVNMRPAGGHDPDMMNYAQSIDVYSIYADMVMFDERRFPDTGERYYCAYAARKDGHVFAHTQEEITERYGADLVLTEEMPPIDWPSMGRYVYMAKFKEKADMEEYFRFVLG